MSIILKETVKPSDFIINGDLMGSMLRKSEKETIARNIIVISLKNGDGWFDFTFADYKAHCAPRTYFSGEESYLNELVAENKILDKNGDVYSVNENFFRVLAQFIK
jgi:hypothetical protein